MSPRSATAGDKMSRLRERRRQDRRKRNLKLVAVGVSIAALAWSVWALRSSGGPGSSARPISQLRTRDFHSLVFSAGEPETVYFGHHAGLLVSRNGGLDWRPTALQNADAMALAAPPSDPAIMYAAGHNVFLKSVDGGQDWEPARHNLPGLDIHGFAADPARPELVYAHVVGFGIFLSEDAGETWELRSSDLSAVNLAVGETAETLYAAAAQSGLFRSTDAGRSWSRLPAPPGEGTVSVAFDRNTGRLYVSTFGQGAGLYLRTEDGSQWQPLIEAATMLAVAVSPHDSGHLLAVDDGGRVYASRDVGASWLNE